MIDLLDLKCNCGKPARYTHADGYSDTWSCNKYNVCLPYNDLLQELSVVKNQLGMYQSCVNQIDDYFEYVNESTKDRKKVHQILGNLTDDLKGAAYV